METVISLVVTSLVVDTTLELLQVVAAEALDIHLLDMTPTSLVSVLFIDVPSQRVYAFPY